MLLKKGYATLGMQNYLNFVKRKIIVYEQYSMIDQSLFVSLCMTLSLVYFGTKRKQRDEHDHVLEADFGKGRRLSSRVFKLPTRC